MWREEGVMMGRMGWGFAIGHWMRSCAGRWCRGEGKVNKMWMQKGGVGDVLGMRSGEGSLKNVYKLRK